MNTYKQLKDRQQEEFNKFPIGAAFSDKQFEEVMRKWNLTVDDTDKIAHIGGNCFIRLSDKDAFFQMIIRFGKEVQDAVNADKTGNGFIKEMFLYELANHEYCITNDITETLAALGLTIEEVKANKCLLNGLNKARKEYLKNCNY